MIRDIFGFSVAPNMQRLISVNGFYAAIMRAEKKEFDSNKLPSGMPIPILPVDFLKDRPDFWIGGENSYVCPVDSDWALWFNWQMNRKTDVAILPSIKGMNPLTGQKINGLSLEKYVEKCPIHNCDFQYGKFCPECNFKWPIQNYISDPDPLYLDGFRTADGNVRQFYFTEDMTKSIPELIIGKENTVPAFGFCFYKSKIKNEIQYEDGKRLKNKMPENTDSGSRLIRSSGGEARFRSCMHLERKVKLPNESSTYFVSNTSSETKYASSFNCSTLDNDCLDKSKLLSKGIEKSFLRSVTLDNVEVGIGAGSKIQQKFIGDSKMINDWEEKPAAIMRIYFVFREQFEKYVESGLNNLSGEKDGYLSGLPIGGVK